MFIEKAKYIASYQIQVWFTDGTTRVIELFSFLKKSKNHMVSKYLDLALFSQFRVEDGTLCWGDNDFDLNPANIYNGQYDAQKHFKVKSRKTTA